MLTKDERYIITENAQRCCTTAYRDRIFQSLMLRAAQDQFDKAYIQQAILCARQQHLAWKTRTQRHWQSSVSRRPQRTRHHDSWAIRESYVRGGSYTDYLPTPGAPKR